MKVRNHSFEELKSQFLLSPNITHLNHGSFGACPKTVFADYQKWQLELEENTVHFFARRGPKLLEAAREALGEFVGADKDDLVFVTNPSYALNTIIKDFNLQPGDEILSNDLEYGAMDRAWKYYCDKAGAKYVQPRISLPVTSKEQIIDEIFSCLTSKTKAVFVSHITSTTGLLMPVEEICERAKAKGLITIVDGAHAPGQIRLNLRNLKADIYTGACHKWLLTPKGCSFLYVRRELQPFDPLLISWGFQSDNPSHSEFIDHHELQGTRDFSAFLTIDSALQFRKTFDWEGVAARCREMVVSNYQRFAQVTQGKTICPPSNEFLVQMGSILIDCPNPEELQKVLYLKYKIEIPVMPHWQYVFLRYSINGYNSQSDMERLFVALAEIKEDTKLLG